MVDRKRLKGFIHKNAASLVVVPALIVVLIFYFGSSVWSVVMSFTASKIFPEMTFVGIRQYLRLFNDPLWLLSLKNLGIYAVGSLASLILGFILAVLLEANVIGERAFKTVFLYPMAISLIITGLVWQWLFNPTLGLQQFFRDMGLTNFNFDWISNGDTVMFAIVLAATWQSTGFFMVLNSAGIKGINGEVWAASRIDGIPKFRMYIEVIIPMMKFTFLTSFVLLSIGAVKAYDIVVAMTNGGPGGHSVVPSYYIVEMYTTRRNLGLGAAGSSVLMLLVLGFIIIFGLANSFSRRRK